MIVTIHQPDFLPWLGFFDRWSKSDLYMVLDDVQFLRRGWHHRDKIKTRNGEHWLTVPVIKKNNYQQLIKDVCIDNSSNWRKKHLRTIELNYKTAPYFDRYFSKIKEIYSRDQNRLIDLNLDFLHFLGKEFDIDTPITFASQNNSKSASTQRLVDLVKAVGGNIYLTGTGSKDYLDESLFVKSGIEVVWQQYEQPRYNQLYGEFIPFLSVLDYLMMKGLKFSV